MIPLGYVTPTETGLKARPRKSPRIQVTDANINYLYYCLCRLRFNVSKKYIHFWKLPKELHFNINIQVPPPQVWLKTGKQPQGNNTLASPCCLTYHL